MRLKEEFVLRQVAGTWIVLPVGKTTANFNGMITLNESGVVLWKELEQGADIEKLADSLMKEYAVDREQAIADVSEFVEKLKLAGCLQ